MKIRRRKVFAGLLGVLSGAGAIARGSRAIAQSPEAIEVSTPEEFFRAIGSNRTIKLVSSHYNLSQLDPELSWANARMEEDFDGYGLVISGVQNLKIEGATRNLPLISIEAGYPSVIQFKNCQNITLSNVEAGHWPKKSTCGGSVFGFDYCENITIERSVLFGCGIYGVYANQTWNLKLLDSTIKECTYGITFLSLVGEFLAENCEFYNNQAFIGLVVSQGPDAIRFKNCQFYNNSVGYEDDASVPIFSLSDSGEIIVENSTIRNNAFGKLSNEESQLKLVGTQVENNEIMFP